MLYFVLEDQPERIEWFRTHLAPSGEMVVARTVEQGLLAFAGLRPEMVFLDHDLDNDAYSYDDALHSGTVFVNNVLCRELEFPGLRKAARVVVHSANPPGAQRMVAALQCAGISAEWIPYMILKTRLKSSWPNLDRGDRRV